MFSYNGKILLTVGLNILVLAKTEDSHALQETILTGGKPINVFTERGQNNRLKPKHSFTVDDPLINPPGSWPWAVSVGTKENEEWFHECDGVIVTGNHVITSASCLSDYEYSSGKAITTLSVRAGDDHLKIDIEEDVQDISVIEYKMHPEFDLVELEHYKDIAVLTLSFEFLFSDVVKPAFLPIIEEALNSTKLKETDKSMAICGWGGTHADDRGRTLEDDVITSVSNDYCTLVYKGDGLNGTLITDDLMCAVNVITLRGTCAGGKGSGIFRLNGEKRFVLTGILSSNTDSLSGGIYRKDCGSPNSPNVFVRVSSLSIITFLYHVIYNIDVGGGVSFPPPQVPQPIPEVNLDKGCGINNVIDKVFDLGLNMSEDMLGRWPWLVPLFMDKKLSGQYTFFCAGTILSETTLLTAAHCFDQVNENHPIKARAGDVWLNKSFDNSLVQEVTISKSDIIVHSHYKRNRYFDLAIIHLKSPLIYTTRVRNVCLLSSEEASKITKNDEVSLSLAVSGWGEEKYWLSGISLNQNVASIYSTDICDRTHEDVHGRANNLVPNQFTEDVLCAGDPAGRSGTCKGDSGGGAVHFDQRKQRYVLRAVVSGSKLQECGTWYAPNIYARLEPGIMNWIYFQLRIVAMDEGQNTEVSSKNLVKMKTIKVTKHGNVCHDPSDYVCHIDGISKCVPKSIRSMTDKPLSDIMPPCAVPCEDDFYWCEERGSCIWQGEVCDCGPGKIYCSSADEYSCESRKSILQSAIFNICPDGSCQHVRNNCSVSQVSEAFGTEECRNGQFGCGTSCLDKAKITEFRDCRGECVSIHQNCYKTQEKITGISNKLLLILISIFIAVLCFLLCLIGVIYYMYVYTRKKKRKIVDKNIQTPTKEAARKALLKTRYTRVPQYTSTPSTRSPSNKKPIIKQQTNNPAGTVLFDNSYLDNSYEEPNSIRKKNYELSPNTSLGKVSNCNNSYVNSSYGED